MPGVAPLGAVSHRFNFLIFLINVKGKPGKVKKTKNRLKGEGRSGTYLTHVCRLPWSIEYVERSTSTADESDSVG